MHKKLCIGIMLVAALMAFMGTAQAAIPKDTLVYGFNTGIFITLDPGVCFEVFPSVVVKNVYAKLVGIEFKDDKFVVIPDLAESWEMAEDGKTWTFHLRDAKFDNGDPVMAEDVVWSLARVVTLAKSPAWLFTDVLGLTEESFTAVDEKTIQIVTNGAPSNVVLTNFGGSNGGILNKKVVLENEKDGDLGEAWLTDHSAGAGPYVVKEWKRNMRIILMANENYWGAQPAIKTVIVQDVPEAADQFLLLKKGEIDVAHDLTAEQARKLEAEAGDVHIVSTPVQTNEYLGMNAGWGPLKDVRVRQAIKYTVDYDAIIEKVRAGFAINNQQFLPVGYLGYVENNPYKQDLEKAKALLAEAGYADGFEVELVTNTTERRKGEAIIIQENLAQVGIKATVTIMQASQMYAKYRKQGINMIVAGWGVDYPDPAALSDPFTNHRMKQLAWRLAWEVDEAADLAEAANKELDEGKRTELYQELTNYWHENGPFAMLYQAVWFWGVGKELKGAEEAFAGYAVHCDFTKFSK